MKSNEQLRKEFEEQTGNKAIVFPACHGETGYASWEYQLWLEQKLLEEYAQQSQPSGMWWVRVEDYKGYDGRILVFSPIYPIRDLMRYRIIDSQFLKTCKDVTHYHILKEPSESSPAGAAEGVRNYCQCSFAMIRRGEDGKAYCFECKKEIDEAEGASEGMAEALSLLKEYEQWEADLISDNEMWWPSVPKDRISGKTYDKMLELQEKRNKLLASLSPASNQTEK